ncbi:MAG: hypothetical protein M9894_12300 [Planctomycetes bacterium]|nr:hypothetical protein [Planctomycetota bacterium]
MLDDPRLTVLHLALGPVLCTAGLRAFARWARGGTPAWLPLGVVALALGLDALRLLDRRAAEAPWPWARGLVWALIALAAAAAVRRVWKDLGAASDE